MFFHAKQFQHNAKPDAPDPVFAKQMQELIGGQWGEMSVMLGHLFQGWNCRGPAKYRDMLLDTAGAFRWAGGSASWKRRSSSPTGATGSAA